MQGRCSVVNVSSLTGRLALAALLAVAGVGCSFWVHAHDGHGEPRHAAQAGTGYHDDRGPVLVISAKVGGKNVFIPSTIVVTEGSGRSLSLFNTTDTPHGFTIPALGVEAILPSREEFPIPLPPLTGGNVYQIQCHLHPPHRSATLVVLPAR